MQSPVLAGASFIINGSGFTKGSEVNFFVSTSSGSIHEATLKPDAATITATELTVPVPATISLGQGFVSVVVVNTDQVSFPQSNPGFALLQGSAAAGLPSITGLDGDPLAATSLDPDFAVANVETTLLQGSSVVDQRQRLRHHPWGRGRRVLRLSGNRRQAEDPVSQCRQCRPQTGFDHFHPAGDDADGAGVDHREQRGGRELQRQEQRGVGAVGGADQRDQSDPEREHDHG